MEDGNNISPKWWSWLAMNIQNNKPDKMEYNETFVRIIYTILKINKSRYF